MDDTTYSENNQKRLEKEGTVTAADAAQIFYIDPTDEHEQLRWRHRRNWRAAAGSVAGGLEARGYRKIRMGGLQLYAHRVRWLLANGQWPVGQIDHINGNRADNRIANLREVSRSENLRNTKLRSDNVSGVAGVSWHIREQRWYVWVSAAGRVLSLGYYDHIFDAAAARKSAEREHGYHENHGRVAS